MEARRCAAPACGRFVRRGTLHCGRHATVLDEQADGDWDEAKIRDRAEFGRRLATGDYRQLFGEVMRKIIRQAANEPGLADEIGVLRVVLARLLCEERDPAALAASVSRVATVAIQAARAQRAISGDKAQELTEAITRVLLNLDQVE